MQLFLKLFGRWLQLVYVCFDRVVIHGYLSFLMREENVVYFFREVGGVAKITREVFLVHRPSKESMPNARIERAYHKVDESIDDLVELLAA
jgi:hypothetical protein